MNFLDELTGIKSIFLDTAPVIYYIEAHPKYSPLMKNVVKFIQAERLIAYTSVITISEVLPRPVALGKEELINKFINFLGNGKNINLLEISADIAELAGKMRGKYNSLKTMDAIQLSASIIAGTDSFLTNDIKLKQIEETKILILEDFM